MSKKRETGRKNTNDLDPSKTSYENLLIDASSMEEIDNAAMQSTPNEVFEKILKHAKKMTHVDTVRIRLVDYTGCRLVPMDIDGSFPIDDFMAVRSFQNGIIGRVARNQKTERIENIQEDPDYKLFLDSIKNKSKSPKESADVKDKYKQYANFLKKIKSSIIVPITIAKIPGSDKDDNSENYGDKELIGIININSINTPLTEIHEKILNDFSSKLTLTFLNRRSFLLQKLHKIEDTMVSSCSWNEVARHIVDGLKEILPGSIPNIYILDENKEKNPFTPLTAPDTTSEVLYLGTRLPRWTEGKIGGLGQLAITNREFVVIEDVQNNSAAYEICAPCDESGYICKKEQKPRITASEGAKENNITTVGCQPLIFHGRVVGILYLHFKDKIHFFTHEEKKILNLFAFSAAIAIKNLSTSPSFKELSGENLINYVKNYKSKNDNPTLNLVVSELNKMTEELENSQGTNEIVLIINKGIRSIGTRLHMPKELYIINSRFQKYEELLLFNIPNYRDHFVHTFFVFSMGLIILDKWIENKVPVMLLNEDSVIENTMKSWYICSIMHDVAYPVSQVKKWVPKFPQETLGLPCDFNTLFDWTPFVLSSEIQSYIDKISHHFGEKIFKEPEKDKKINAFRLWFYSQLLNTNDHGVLASLAVMNIDEEDDFNNILVDAALAIALHNYVKSEKILDQLEIETLPLAFLLTYCDVVQEWGRPTGNVSADTRLQEIMRMISFKDLIVNQNTTKIILQYNPEKDFGTTIADKNAKSIIKDIMRKNTESYPEGWCRPISSHNFQLQVNRINEEKHWDLRTIC